MADNLIQKKGESTWYVRLAIPPDVQKAFGGRKVLTQSLKTGLRSEAMFRRLQYLSTWKQQIADARAGRKPPEDWQTGIVDQLQQIDGLLRDEKRRIIGEDVILPPHSPEVVAQMLANPKLREIITSFINPDLSGIAGRIYTVEAINKFLKAVVPAKLERNFILSSEQRTELSALTNSPQAYKPRSPITKAMLEQFREYRALHNISAKNIDTQEARLKALSNYLSTQGKQLTFDSVAEFVKTIDRSPATQQQFVLAGAAFWKWAMKYRESWRNTFKGQPSPFAGHEFPKLKGKAKVDSDRKDYSPEDVLKLHAGALAAKQLVLADLISLGYYTGARIEELCKLRTENLIMADGVLTFDITDSKTIAGIRQVPVHPALFPLVERLKEQSTDGWALPITAKNKYVKRSDSLSKKFGRLRDSLGFSSAYVFHSLRMTTITQLHRGGVPAMLIAEIVGHETGTITFDVYSQGASPAQKLAAIGTIPVFNNGKTIEKQSH